MKTGPLDKDNGSASGDNAMAKKVADCMGKPDPKQGMGISGVPSIKVPEYGSKQ
jgi:hypothetical protein